MYQFFFGGGEGQFLDVHPSTPPPCPIPGAAPKKCGPPAPWGLDTPGTGLGGRGEGTTAPVGSGALPCNLPTAFSRHLTQAPTALWDELAFCQSLAKIVNAPRHPPQMGVDHSLKRDKHSTHLHSACLLNFPGFFFILNIFVRPQVEVPEHASAY